jgi:hypothetical protein
MRKLHWYTIHDRWLDTKLWWKSHWRYYIPAIPLLVGGFIIGILMGFLLAIVTH